MELAQKYYALGTDRPELRQDLFGTASTDVDVSLIKRVNIFRAKDDKFLCVPQIEGMGKIEAREVSRLQWHRKRNRRKAKWRLRKWSMEGKRNK